MRKPSRVLRFVFAATVLSLCTACASSTMGDAEAPLAAGPPTIEAPLAAGALSTEILLTLEEGADPCAVVDPPTATIWQPPAPGKPVQAVWVVDGPPTHRWVMEAKPGSPGLGFFGKRVIHCGRRTAPSGLPQKPGKGEWTYSISVYECDGEVPASEPICVIDPVIIIRDDGGEDSGG